MVAALSPTVVESLRLAPWESMTGLGLAVSEVPELADRRGAGGWCDGLSLTDHGVIFFVPTPHSRRQNFTLLHEYAHNLVDEDDEALNWLADQVEPTQATEQLCDEIAAAILIPPSVLDAIVSAGPVQAQHLLVLHRETEASQVVSAIALSHRLGAAGSIVLIDRADNTVAWAANVGDLRVRPYNRQAIPDPHPLRRLQPGQSLRLESFWATPWGDRQQFYLDAVATARRTYAVLAVTDLWQIARFHAGEDLGEQQSRPVAIRSCPCGYRGRVTGYPCPTCDTVFCPKCGECRCAKRDAKLVRCKRCTISVPARDIQDGRCSECR